MTTDRDADRIIRAWLDLMPDEAPDRAIAAVLQAVETTPQARRPLVRGPWRSTPMTRFALIAAAAVLGAALLGGALLVGGGDNANPVPTPASSAALGSPMPSAAPSPTAAPAAALPASLRYRWIGQPRPHVPGHGTSSRTGLNFGPHTFSLTGTQYSLNASLLASTAAISADGKLRLGRPPRALTVPAGAVGAYAWSLDPAARS